MENGQKYDCVYAEPVEALLERGIIPENMPAGEDIKKVERRLASEEKKIQPKKK